MGVIDDMLKALDRIPGWARLQQVPGEVDELKAKVATLEEKLGSKWPPDVCKFCGERAARLANSWPPDGKGLIRQDWKCEKCEQYELHAFKPGPG